MKAPEFDSRIVKIEGPARSGKTEAMLLAIARLIEQGSDPSSIAYIANTAFACQAARERLAKMLPEDLAHKAAEVEMGRAADFCIRVLKTPEAHAFNGRVARVLSADERNFFLEDMKTMGQPVRRLKKMLDFFFAKWSNLEPESEWIEPGEELNSRKLMARLLKSEHAMLPEEVAPLAYTFLRSDAGSGERKAFAEVFVDDFQNLTRAEQDCACLLAANRLIVAGNIEQASGKANANALGFSLFEAARQGVQVIKLNTTYGNAEAQSFVASVLKQEFAHQDTTEHLGKGILELVKWNTPEEELAGIAELVRHDIQEGLTERDICLMAPNKLWARTAAKELAKRGVKSTQAAFMTRLGGDPREASRCRALIAYIKLSLLADPGDVVAWRAWCGIGNYLTNSDAWLGLVEFSEKNEIELIEGLVKAAEMLDCGQEPFLRAAEIVKRHEEGLAFIEKAKGRKGFALLRAIGASELGEFETLQELMQGDENPRELHALALEALNAPQFNEDPHLVRIMGYGDVSGLEFKSIYALGAIDGFIPGRDAFETVSTDENRSNSLCRWRKLFCDALSKSTDSLLISTFSKADLETAERTKMLVRRVRADGGKRVALLSPSSFIAEAQAACPGAIGGQTKLSQIGKA